MRGRRRQQFTSRCSTPRPSLRSLPPELDVAEAHAARISAVRPRAGQHHVPRVPRHVLRPAVKRGRHARSSRGEGTPTWAQPAPPRARSLPGACSRGQHAHVNRSCRRSRPGVPASTPSTSSAVCSPATCAAHVHTREGRSGLGELSGLRAAAVPAAVPAASRPGAGASQTSQGSAGRARRPYRQVPRVVGEGEGADGVVHRDVRPLADEVLQCREEERQRQRRRWGVGAA